MFSVAVTHVDAVFANQAFVGIGHQRGDWHDPRLIHDPDRPYVSFTSPTCCRSGVEVEK